MKHFLLIVIVVFFFAACGNSNGKKTNATETLTDTSVNSARASSFANVDPSIVYVYFFQGSERCETAVAINGYAREAVKQLYNDNQKVQFLEMRTDEGANKYLVEKYGVIKNALIISKGDDYINITQNAFEDPEGVQKVLKHEVDQRL